MDFLLIYSDYSQACGQLFQMYSNLKETKGLCADTTYMRELLLTELKVTAVPTLLVIDQEKVLQRVIGIDNIKNWLWMISNDINAISSDTPPDQEFHDNLLPPIQEPARVQSTHIEEPPILPKVQVNSIKNVAEEMQRQREEQLNIKPI